MCFGSQLIYQFSVSSCFVQQINTICQIQNIYWEEHFASLWLSSWSFSEKTIATCVIPQPLWRLVRIHQEGWLIDELLYSSENLTWGISLQISLGNVYCCAHQPSLVCQSALHLQLWESEPANYRVLSWMMSFYMHFRDIWGLGSFCILHTINYDHYVIGIYRHTHQVSHLIKKKQNKPKPTYWICNSESVIEI